MRVLINIYHYFLKYSIGRYNINMVDIFDKTRSKKLSRYKNDIVKYTNKAFSTLRISNKHKFTVIICGSAAIKRLNNDYRGINKTTDVLSFEEYDLDDEDMYLFKASLNIKPPISDCNEGTLKWVKSDELLSLPMWEGDKVFLEKMANNITDINLTLVYSKDKLVNVIDESPN